MVTGNLSPLLLAGIFYLIITVPLTHVVNYIDQRLRMAKQGHATGAPASGLVEVSELKAATAPSIVELDKKVAGGSVDIRGLSMS